MSFIIDRAKIKYFYNFNKNPQPKSLRNPPCQLQTKQKQTNTEAKFFEIALNQQKISYIRSAISQTKIRITLQQMVVLPQLQGLISFTFFRRNHVISINISLMHSQNRYYKIPNLEDRLFLNKKLLLVLKDTPHQHIKSNINFNTGHVQFSMPIYNLFQIKQSSEKMLTPKNINLNRIYYFMYKQFQRSIRCMNILQNKLQSQSSKVSQLYKGLRLLNVHRKQTFLEKEQIQSAKDEKNRENKAIKAFFHNRITIPEDMTASLSLFCSNQSDSHEIKDKNACQYQKQKEQVFLKHLAIKEQNQRFFRADNPSTDCKIISTILIREPEKMVLKNINRGGFSSIFQGEMIFWLVKEEQTPASLKNIVEKMPPMKTMVVVKKEQLKGGKMMGKNTHQKNIISVLKNSKSSYLNKYYTTVNKGGFFANDILMDKVSPLNLNEYMCLRKESISLSSKVILFFHIVQAMRSLSQFNVVHMDLKPANIIVNSIFDIKLIDFGQSYHPKVCQKGYKPGYTIPYSCPQVKQQSKTFNQKNDLFSFGVILHEILYKRYPFYFYDDRNLSKLASKQYISHWFFSEEESEYNLIVFHLLNQIISKCLDSEIQRRPDLTRVSILLFECLDAMIK